MAWLLKPHLTIFVVISTYLYFLSASIFKCGFRFYAAPLLLIFLAFVYKEYQNHAGNKAKMLAKQLFPTMSLHSWDFQEFGKTCFKKDIKAPPQNVWPSKRFPWPKRLSKVFLIATKSGLQPADTLVYCSKWKCFPYYSLWKSGKLIFLLTGDS